jgi:cytidylate kinase
VVFDQGPAYTVGRMRATGGAEPAGALAATAAVLDLLVVLQADPDTLAGRVLGRSKSHAATAMTPHRQRAYLEAESGGARSLGVDLEALGVTVLRLDTGLLRVEEQVRAVLDTVCPPPARHAL